MAPLAVALAGRTTSLILLLGVWEAAARLAHSRLFPGAGAVLATLAEETVHGDLFHHLGATLLRVAVAFALAMAAGSAIGIAMGLARTLAVLLYVWFGLTEAAAIGAVSLSKLPTVVVTLREGTRALDRDLASMARSF